MNSTELQQVAVGLRKFQIPSGFILQTLGGVGDPWNHVEVLMALTISGDFESAKLGYRWLKANQLGDGSWFHYYRDTCVQSSRIDFNVTGYLATGLLQYWKITKDKDFIHEMWPTLVRSVKLIEISMDDSGFIPWSIDSRGFRAQFSLLTGSSSLFHSMHSANELALEIGVEPLFSDHKLSGLQHRLSTHQDTFANKSEFAMDWYYPSLSGAQALEQNHRQDFEAKFLIDQHGVLCVSNSEWVTTAETAEYAMTLVGAGERKFAKELIADLEWMRTPKGLYFTGIGHRTGHTFPRNEISSYGTAAVVLALDAIEEITPAHAMFTVKRPEAKDISCSLC